MKSLYLLLICLCSCSPPKDPNNSYMDAKQHGLRVGIVNNPPYTVYNAGKASGTEVKILESFANSEGLKTEYIYGSETTLMKQLENYEIDLFIGGFNKKTVWKNKAGLTIRYNGENVFLIAKGENELLYRLESALLKHKNNGS